MGSSSVYGIMHISVKTGWCLRSAGLGSEPVFAAGFTAQLSGASDTKNVAMWHR